MKFLVMLIVLASAVPAFAIAPTQAPTQKATPTQKAEPKQAPTQKGAERHARRWIFRGRARACSACG